MWEHDCLSKCAFIAVTPKNTALCFSQKGAVPPEAGCASMQRLITLRYWYPVLQRSSWSSHA